MRTFYARTNQPTGMEVARGKNCTGRAGDKGGEGAEDPNLTRRWVGAGEFDGAPRAWLA